MRNFLLALWHRGFIGTFLTGLFALLPLVVTLWILISSEGPLGNIGMPTSIEGIRHFEKMIEAVANRMTEDEIAALIDALKEP